MRVVRSVDEVRAALERRRSRPSHPHAPEPGLTIARPALCTVGLVPTMGALHEGHLSLIRTAREQCDTVVVSLFVNPSQFNEGSDLARYPRREGDDVRLAEQAGADILFAPSVEEVYPEGFSTAVEVLGLTDRLEGACRGASHFRGVTTVVKKLLNMVSPDIAYFGQKDAQQVAVIKRMVTDLNMPVAIEVCGTVRESDGLAMSSRNSRLTPDQRERAGALFEALEQAADLAYAGERSARKLTQTAHEAMTARGVEPEYLELVNPSTFEPIDPLQATALLVVAARIGETRLIDNFVLDPALPGATPTACRPTSLAG
ncbi:MAG: pantoate--beta-alanine ligase [Solirubrobacteraceae bacterium]